MSKSRDRKLKAVCLKFRKCTTKETGFTSRKATDIRMLKRKKTRLQWAKEKQSWTVDDWVIVIFTDESSICIGQGDDVGMTA